MSNSSVADNLVLASEIKFYFSAITAPIGVVINTISSITFFKKSLNKSTNMGILYGCLCILNIITLINFLVFDTLNYFNVDYYDYSEFTCKFLNIWIKIASQFPSFQQVLIAFFLCLQTSYLKLYKKAVSKTYWLNLALFSYIMLTASTNFGYYIGADPSLDLSSQINATKIHMFETIFRSKLMK